MKNPRRLFAIVLSVLVTGCGSGVSWISTDPVVLSPKPARYEMPVSSNAASRPHRTLGELRVSLPIEPSFEQTGTYERALEQLKNEARKRGADAIVDLKALDGQENPDRGRLTLAGTLVIFTAPLPAGSEGPGTRK